MANAESKERAFELLGSARGQYIVSQALFLAIEKLESIEPEVMREVSNIADMRFLLENLFPMFLALASVREEFFDLREAKKG
jgi:hypothetical protein